MLAAQADAACPGWIPGAPQQGVTVRGWQTSCVSTGGVDFSGLGAEVLWAQAASDQLLVDGWSVRLDGTIEGGGAALRSSGGAVTSLFADHAEYPFWYRQWEGGGVQRDDDDGLRTTLSWQAVQALPVNARWASLDGSVTGLDGAVDAVAVDALVVLDSTLAGDCAGEPAGTLSVREADGGRWWDVVFHGRRTAEDVVDVAQCDGCGDAWYGGVRRGRVCVELGELVSWDAAPW